MGKAYRHRRKSDLVYTPYSMTDQLFEYHKEMNLKSYVLEPACGRRHMVEILNKYFKDLYFYDINMIGDNDFLKERRKWSYIITNPPYSIANKFILKAMELTQHQFCFLLPLVYLQGQKRYDEIYQNDFKLKYIYIFIRMPMLRRYIRKDGTYPTGMQTYAWYVWDKFYTGEPIIKWIDNRRFCKS